MTRTDCLERASEWLERAERGYANDAKPLALAADMYARAHLAAAIANVYATMADRAG